MALLKWDNIGEHFFETGVDHGVFYPSSDAGYGKGEAWNGLTSFTKSPEGAEPNDIYADNMKYLTLMSAENLKGTIGCYTYPKGFRAALGCASPIAGVTIGQQSHKPFGFVCRTMIGNDEAGQDFAYKLHIVYGMLASPSEEAYNTVNDSPEAMELSYEFSCTPVPVSGYKNTSIVEIDSRDYKESAAKARLQALEDMLFGTDPDEDSETEGTDPQLVMPDKIIELLSPPAPTPDP